MGFWCADQTTAECLHRSVAALAMQWSPTYLPQEEAALLSAENQDAVSGSNRESSDFLRKIDGTFALVIPSIVHIDDWSVMLSCEDVCLAHGDRVLLAGAFLDVTRLDEDGLPLILEDTAMFLSRVASSWF